ncbi:MULTISPECIES: hypothetical protein [unclassified Frankia]
MATTRTTNRPASRPTARVSTQTQEDTAEARAEVKVPLAEVRKPLYASVGAADLAVAKLLALPTTTSTEVRKISDRVGALPTQAARVPTQVGTAVRALPATVTSQISDLQGRATHLYNSFATRGEKRVASIRRSPATEEAVQHTRTAVSQTRAARTSSRKAAEAVGRAVTEAAPEK